MAIPHRFRPHWSLCCAASTAENPVPHSLSSGDASTRGLLPVSSKSSFYLSCCENFRKLPSKTICSRCVVHFSLSKPVTLLPAAFASAGVCKDNMQLTCHQKARLYDTSCSAQLSRTSSPRRPASLLNISERAHHKGCPQASRSMRHLCYQWCSCAI